MHRSLAFNDMEVANVNRKGSVFFHFYVVIFLVVFLVVVVVGCSVIAIHSGRIGIDPFVLGLLVVDQFLPFRKFMDVCKLGKIFKTIINNLVLFF